MDLREKLIELLKDCVYENVELDDGYVGYDVNYGNIADCLIANGVTVQEWISVKDRFPETNGYHVWVIACVDGKRSCIRMFERKMARGKVVERFKYPWETISAENITHWMKLPEPPKGD